MTINVLVTGAGGGVGQGIIKAIKLISDLNISIVSADMSALASGLYGGHVSQLVPAATSKDYFERISEICQEHSIDYYFPGTDVELLQCAEHAAELQKKLNVKILVSPLGVIEIADDKLKTVNFLKNNDLDYPKSFPAQDAELNQLTYPVIVKPRVGCRSIGVHLVNNAAEAKTAINNVDAPIVQEYISGDEFTCTVAIRAGIVSDVLCLKRDLRAGDTFRAFPEKNIIIETYVKKIALALNIDGSCNFQLRLDNGVPKLFEINSRFSGTTPFCAYLGFNPVEFCLKADLGIEYKSDIQYDKVVLRHWSEVVLDKKSLDDLTVNKTGTIEAKLVSSMI
ncbi:ATP-grasp domain-containing protein [Vibrio lentus]|uniref:ATP-grasp domain-containing protein n=1 Tax=Vibrio lentus TaxID=136468 RepID=A0A855IPR2_9VIBR|nr:ATP-grasp domain-containing protein [Vibrio lentus]PMJ62387.1 hypothetical protein BCU18_22855 [Vibrio lentus]PMJ90121.1 hypothetical protein BCU14_24740 [Vibrio lentus]PMM58022.1 hypothetical protein BCT50_22970 [Vibrio lentus]PMN41935.1 hypothetical protein BCT33_00285 [Vibrio lentus]PMN59039.1 hypothetical protein BCT29_25170 [Vibrio lentus]